MRAGTGLFQGMAGSLRYGLCFAPGVKLEAASSEGLSRPDLYGQREGMFRMTCANLAPMLLTVRAEEAPMSAEGARKRERLKGENRLCLTRQASAS